MTSSDFLDRIESSSSVMMGKPVIAGTCITVESILDKLAAGESIDDLLEAHPRLSRTDVQAALEYAANVLRTDVVGPVSKSTE